MKFLLTLTFCAAGLLAFSQNHGFPFGQITPEQFEKMPIARDSSAEALVLNEFGESYISNDDHPKLILEHHFVIKILKQSGTKEADIIIPLSKSGDQFESLLSVSATSYNLENGSIKKATVELRNVFTENKNKYVDWKKFTIPNVRAGSIIEVSYSLESPFFGRNFRTWYFQSNLPKVRSEYWASIPGNYVYNISLKGFLKLTKNDGEIIKECFNVGGGAIADCARYKYEMKNIPPFVEEDYMTASSNFIASVNFELLEVKHFNGRTDKVTNEWKDVDEEMLRDNYFGVQIKKGKDIAEKISPKLVGIADPLERGKKIYDLVQSWYQWNRYYGKYSDGIKKAYEAKTGDIADINLSLVAALRYNGLDVEPLILSTRDNGFVTELFPVLSDFNYVIAKLNIDGKVYLLDATDQSLPFGMLPERCLNGKGRVFPDKKPSYWYDLKPTDKYRKITVLDLSLEPSGVFKGTINHQYFGYSAFEKRKKIFSFNSKEEYLADLKKDMHQTSLLNYEVKGEEDSEGPLTEKFEVEINGFDNLNSESILMNPFFSGKIENNPFRSNERLYPVDFGAPVETKVVLNLALPPSLELEIAPERRALTLPNGGGKFIFETSQYENKLIVNYLFSIDKTIFSSAEYHYLKEIYDRVIETQRTDLIFVKKKG